MSALGSAELFFRVRSFIARETRLLQEGRFEEWLQLFTPDARYWMPIATVAETRAGVESGPSDLALFDENVETLTLRVRRLRSRTAWTEIPPSRLRYFVDPYSVEPVDAGRVKVMSNLLVRQCRLHREDNLFTGYREDLWQEADGGYAIAERRVVLDEAVIQAKNMTLFV